MNEQLTIGLAGDVMLGRTLDSIISQRGFSYPWGNVLPLMKKTHLNIINLETTLTNSEQKVEKTFNFKATPDKIESLIKASVSIVNLANNHMLDFEKEGLLETIKTLDDADIKHVGAGRNLAEAEASIIITQKGIRLGVLGFTDNEPTWKASNKPGTNYVDIGNKSDINRILQAIKTLRKQADIIIVSIHWGPNMLEKPSSEFIEFAHAMIDHGANVIHGHSAHIIQGIEYYKGNLILYDTGDFVDDYVVDPELRNDLSAFYLLTVNKAGLVNLKIIPVRIFNYQVNTARNEDYKWVIERIRKLSADFNTDIDKDGNISVMK